MEVREFFKEYKRMCANYPSCSDDNCPLNGLTDGCDHFIGIDEEVISTVEKWAAEHPRKTILQDFLEKYPDAKLQADGTPIVICPHTLGYPICENCDINGFNCVACWNRPLEDVKHEG